MSYNIYGEYQLCCWYMSGTKYYIGRDRAGYHVLREGSQDGNELFSEVDDDGKKNEKRNRVLNASKLIKTINERG